MRIGVIASPSVPVPPVAYGGIEASIDLQVRGFQAAGHEVFLWTLGESTCPVPHGSVIDRADGIDIGVGQYEWQHVIHGYEAMRGWGADIVHDHGLAGIFYSSRFPDLRVVSTNSGPFDQPREAVYRAMARPIPIVAISNDQAKSASPDIEIARVIQSGVNPDEFPFGDGNGDERGEYFAFIGRMNAEKGVVEAILAAREAGVRLKIAAKMREEYEHRYFEQNVRQYLNADIEYVGEPGRVERDMLLSKASALINPIPRTHREPFGLVMIEAMACGTPVIASSHASAPEIIDQGRTGLLCQDLGDFVTAFGKVDTLAREDCRSAVETHFSAHRMVDQYLELFETTIQRNQSVNAVSGTRGS